MIGRLHVQRIRTYMLEVVAAPSPLLHTSEIPSTRPMAGEHRGIARPGGGPEPCNARYGPLQFAAIHPCQLPGLTRSDERPLGHVVAAARRRRASAMNTPTAPRSDLQLLVVLAQLISTPRSAPHLPASALFAHAPPQSNLISFLLPSCPFQPHAGKRAKRRRRRAARASRLEASQRPIDCSTDPLPPSPRRRPRLSPKKHGSVS